MLLQRQPLQAKVSDPAVAAGPSPEGEPAFAAGALADLVELQRSGLSVSWPSGPPEPSRASDTLQSADETPIQLCRQTAALQRSEAPAAVSDAHRDLAELEQLGFRVHWT